MRILFCFLRECLRVCMDVNTRVWAVYQSKLCTNQPTPFIHTSKLAVFAARAEEQT